MSLSKKHLVLAVALLATSVAAYFSPEPEGGQVVALSERSVRAVASAKPPEAVSQRAPVASPKGRTGTSVDVLEIRARSQVKDDAVSPSNPWAVPVVVAKPVKAAVVVEAAPPPPTAPPLPFKSLGRYEEDGSVIIFLQHQDRDLVVRLGDTIAEHYKVEGLQGGVLTLRHLPTNQTQTLDVGGAS